MIEEMESKSHSGSFIWVGAAVLIPLLYVLSIGPVLRMFTNSPSPPTGTLRSLYYPVVLLHDHTPLKRPIAQPHPAAAARLVIRLRSIIRSRGMAQVSCGLRNLKTEAATIPALRLATR